MIMPFGKIVRIITCEVDTGTTVNIKGWAHPDLGGYCAAWNRDINGT